jgi:hypothetical protein
MVSGSRLITDFRDDSTAAYSTGCCADDDGRMPIPWREAHRAWQALGIGLRDFDVMPSITSEDGTGRSYDGVNTPVEDVLYGIRHRTNVLKFHVNDFGAGTTPARRPAWWTLKSIDNAMRALNSFGTNIVVWAWPEDMEP